MALGDSYATVAELEAMLGKSDDGTFARLLHDASRQVEAFTRRQFNKSEVPEARRFRALDPERLPVDDFHTLYDLAVETDGQAWDADSYDARPWNGIVDGMEGWPFFDLFAVGRYWPISRRATVYVTAQWGWTLVPAGIVQATLLVAKRLAESSGVGGNTGAVKAESIDGYSVSYGGGGVATLEQAGVPAEMVPALPYRRKRFGVA
jgi:hypothetical protein